MPFTLRNEDRKDKTQDLEMGYTLLSMYLCSGDRNWPDRIRNNTRENFVVTQVGDINIRIESNLISIFMIINIRQCLPRHWLRKILKNSV